MSDAKKKPDDDFAIAARLNRKLNELAPKHAMRILAMLTSVQEARYQAEAEAHYANAVRIAGDKQTLDNFHVAHVTKPTPTDPLGACQ